MVWLRQVCWRRWTLVPEVAPKIKSKSNDESLTPEATSLIEQSLPRGPRGCMSSASKKSTATSGFGSVGIASSGAGRDDTRGSPSQARSSGSGSKCF